MMVTMLMVIMKDDNSKNHKANEQIGDDTFIITIIGASSDHLILFLGEEDPCRLEV